MDFYESIAPYYHHIFPLNPDQAAFVRSVFLQSDELSLLEVGCGIGSLSFDLSTTYPTVIGIDLDKAMLKKAEETKVALTTLENPPLFYQVNMLSMTDLFHAAQFDGILCFGNTLVHLDSEEQVLDFFSQCHMMLKEGGKLLVQILNYDKILHQRITSLPVTDNDLIRFDRVYAFSQTSEKIDFITTLTIKETHQIIRNKISLLPIKKNSLQKLLLQVGFNKLCFYGNYHSQPFTMESEIIVIKAER